NGERTERTEFAAAQLEVAILDRARDHRTFRRIRAARLEELLAEARPAPAAEPAEDDSSGGAPSGSDPTGPSGAAPSNSAPGPSGSAPGSSGSSSSTGPSSPSSPSDTEPPTGP